MKKIALIILTMITIPTYATTMCTTNDTVAIVLDPSEPIKGNTWDTVTRTWSAWSSYGTIRGISACTNKDGGYRGKTVKLLKDTNNNIEKNINGGEEYGSYCWCRMNHPVVSQWVYNMKYSSVAECATACINSYNGCSGVLTYAAGTMLPSFFGSIKKD